MRESRTDDSRRDALHEPTLDPDRAPSIGSDPARPADGIFPAPSAETAGDPRLLRVSHLAQHAEAPLIEGRRFRGWPGLPGVLVAGLKALVMFPVRPGAIPARAIWSIVLALATLVVAIVGDALLLGEDPVAFNWLTLRTSTLDLAILVLASVWLAEPRKSTLRPGPAGSYVVPASPAAATSLLLVPKEPPPPLHFATTVLAATFWTVLAGYGISIALDRQAQAGDDPWMPGIWFYTWFMLWPWWVAIRTLQYQNRYQPIPWWRRLAVILVMLAAIAWSLADPGEPFWIYSEPQAPELLYTFAALFPES